MKMTKAIMLVAMIAGIMLATFSCQTCPFTKPKAQLEVIPAETFLSPALIKKPVSFAGSGFAPKEMVSVEMVLPPGFEMKGVNPGEDVGIAVATTDEKGDFKTAMGPMATLNWFFQVGWTPVLTPNFKEAKPIPPGEYQINATGLDSGRMATSTLKIVPPPKKQ